MSYATILEKLEQTSIDMELKRTQFHDAKTAIDLAEKSLSDVKKKKINHEKMLSYLDFEKAKEAFEEENYDLAIEIAVKSSEGFTYTITETIKLKDDRNKIEELLDEAIDLDKLQFDKKEKDELNKSIKEIDLSIENGEVIVAKERIEKEIDSLEKNIARKRILKFAPSNWNKLKKLDKNSKVDEYYTNEKWDLEGIDDDVKILAIRESVNKDKGTELVGTPDIWKELNKVDEKAIEADYRKGDYWDLKGIREDLTILNHRNQVSEMPTLNWDIGFKPEKEDGRNVHNKPKTKKIKKVKVKPDTTSEKSDINSKNTKFEDLRYLKNLYDEGLIDDDEFKQMKKEILSK